MSRNLFGTDGVRGIVGEYPLDDAGVYAMGRAAGTEFAVSGDTILVACDTRESSRHLVDMISKGLMEVGVNVIFTGVIPTPGLAYLTATHDEFVAGVMITASHNPYEYNGVKIFDAKGGKLPDESEERVNELIENGTPDRGQGTFREQDFSDEYVQFLLSSTDGVRFDGLKVALDLANGASYRVGERVFQKLGAETVVMSDTPNGTNINEKCGATDTNALSQLVLNEQCDLGLAFDGDADRIMMVDRLGRQCDGDHILYILAVQNDFRSVVATVMTNLGTEQALAAKNISLERTTVGDRYVLERLIETGRPLGGEQAGHIIIHHLNTTGDGILAGVQVLKALKESNRSLAEWRDDITLMPQALVNFHIDDKTKLSQPEVVAYVEAETAKFNGQGRLLIRPSGTEPLARVMVEGENARERAEHIAARLQELVS